jgi:hypothetical protein
VILPVETMDDLGEAIQPTALRYILGSSGGGSSANGRREMTEAVRDHWLIAVAVVVLVIAALMWWRSGERR